MASFAFRVIFVLILLITSVTSPVSIQAQEWIYTTRPGDNLWNLSEQYLSSMRYWRQLQALNGISNPKQILPGTRLRFPVAWLKIEAAPVRVLALSGEVFVQSPNRLKKSSLTQDNLLHIQDEVHTGDNGSVTLLFADGSRLLLQAQSQLTLDVITSYGETGMVDSRLRLRNGRLETQVSPFRNPGSRFEIHTPGAITSVRGTELRMMSDAIREISSTEVLKGEVAVSAAGETQVLLKGFGTVVQAGKPPSVPSVLLAAPELSGLPQSLNRLPINFVWPALNGAEAYRIQLAANNRFQKLALDRKISKAQVLISDLENGAYVLRVRGLATSGLEGFDAEHHFLLEVPPDSPALLTPRPNTAMRLNKPTFQWEAVETAHSYHFQLSDHSDFTSTLVDIADFSKQSLEINDSLKPGLYYWRVAASDQDGNHGAFSNAHAFRVRFLPSELMFQTTVVEDEALLVRWQGGRTGELYQIEMARDEAFSDIVFQVKTSEKNTSIARTLPGEYHLRVRAIADDGLRGKYSASQVVNVPFIEAPALLRPTPNAPIRLEELAFQWQAVAKARSYHFQLADNKDFTSTLIDTAKLTEQTFTIKLPLKAERYYWRIAARDLQGNDGAFSTTRTFRIRPAPSTLSFEPIVIADEAIRVQWQGGQASERYLIEMAKNEAFSDIVLRLESAAQNTQIPLPETGEYYLRVRAIADDGKAGAFTAPQFIEVPTEFCWMWRLLSIVAILVAL